jgi:spermidine synthase
MSVGCKKICFDKSKYIVYQPYPGLHVAYHARRFCFSGRSKFQKIDIIDNDAYGRMLFLDDNIQHTAYDSRIFNEALCGPAMNSGAAHVLVLGGGSGQTLMTLLESPSVQQVTLIEIDPAVIACCRQHIKGVDRAFKDPRVNVRIGDAFKQFRVAAELFDAAILDLTERPLVVGSSLTTLRILYADIKQKCRGRCSQYLGSSVGIAYDKRLRRMIDKVSRVYLSNVTYRDVFIPSFGAPHTFMHAGYDQV